MLLKRFLQNAAPARRDNAAPVPHDRLQAMPGFNVLVHGRHGVFLANENDVYVGCALIDYGEYSELEWRLLAQYCAPGDVVVEVGANVGSHSVGFAKRVASGGRVVVVEPQPFVFQALCANLALNCLANADAFNCACGEAEGVLEMRPVDYGARGNFGGVEMRGRGTLAGGIEIAVRPLDALLRPYARVDLLKIDVEGMESAVLRGARATLERFRPVLYVENDRVDRSAELIELVQAFGYRAWWHVPPLFNPENYFGNAHDRYPNTGSFNMLCLPAGREPHDARGLSPVTDPTFHPLKR